MGSDLNLDRENPYFVLPQRERRERWEESTSATYVSTQRNILTNIYMTCLTNCQYVMGELVITWLLCWMHFAWILLPVKGPFLGASIYLSFLQFLSTTSYFQRLFLREITPMNLVLFFFFSNKVSPRFFLVRVFCFSQEFLMRIFYFSRDFYRDFCVFFCYYIWIYFKYGCQIWNFLDLRPILTDFIITIRV